MFIRCNFIGTRNVRPQRCFDKIRNIFNLADSGQPKKHSERKLIKYPVEHVYDVVSDVSKYHEFVPWCTASKVLEKSDHSMKAELAVGFKYLTEHYISNVTLQRPTLVAATSSQTSLFEYLRSEWKFSPSSDGKSTWVTFQVEFKFRLALYNELSDFFLQEVIKKMSHAFEQRCRDVANSNKSK